MAITANHNRLAFCFLVDGDPMDWQLAHSAAKSPEKTYAKVAKWLKFYQPDIVITEDLNGSSRKGRRTQRLILSIKEAVIDSKAQHIEMERYQPFANKYEQVDRLCDQFPQMQLIKPRKRRIFDNEPPVTTVFECLALALQLAD